MIASFRGKNMQKRIKIVIGTIMIMTVIGSIYSISMRWFPDKKGLIAGLLVFSQKEIS